MKQLSLLFLFVASFTFSQNRAPSLYLNYQDNFSGDIIVNTLRVPSTSPMYTYYCSLLWSGANGGNGYAGFQEHPNGRNFIFSMWNPTTTSKQITADYIGAGTIFEPFGGEGEGMKSTNYLIGWNTDTWYTFVSRAWAGTENNTLYGYWIFDNTGKKWTHVITFDYPVPNLTFNSSTRSFIEDWLGNGWLQRTIQHKEGWKRKNSDKVWFPFVSSTFDRVYPDAGTVNYIEKYNGGSTSEYFFMQSGGNSTPTATAPYLLNLPNSKTEPNLIKGQIQNLNVSTTLNKLKLDWTLNNSTLPQFSYNVKIYDNASLSGTPVGEIFKTSPQTRQGEIDTQNLTNGKTYYAKFFITDIFDNISAAVIKSFIANTTNLSVVNYKPNEVTVYPNPFNEYFIIKNSSGLSKNLFITIINSEGRRIYAKQFSGGMDFKVSPESKLPNGIYNLIINDGNDSQTIKIIKGKNGITEHGN